MADKLMPSVQRAYEFAVALYGYGNRFPPIERALRARDLRGLALRLLVTLGTTKRRRAKVPELNEESGTVDALRITLRLSTCLSLLSYKGDEALSGNLDEIGRMLGGWLKHSPAAVADVTEARAPMPDAPAKQPGGGVRYRMTSPLRTPSGTLGGTWKTG
jgi:hypothetical protein